MKNILSFTHTPSPVLNQWIETIWVSESTTLNVHSENGGFLFNELIYSFGDLFSIDGDNTYINTHAQYQCFLSGLRNNTLTTQIADQYKVIGFILRPHSFMQFNHHFHHLSSQEVVEQLYQSAFKNEKPNFKMIEDILLPIIQKLSIDQLLLQFDKAITSDFLVKNALSKYSRSLPYSQKTFIQKFKHQYILTPHQYIQLKQVNKAQSLMNACPKRSLTDISIMSGFYDQPHFCRIFKKHCGVSPLQYVNSVQF